MRYLLLLIAVMIAQSMSVRADQFCGTGEEVCELPSGSYNIELPDRVDPSQKIPAMIYFHGAGGSGARSMKNVSMVDTFLERGYAVIAPSGLKRPNSRFGPGWSFHPNRPKQRDEMVFAKAVLADAAEKFNIDRDRILMTGFSIGGSLTWYLACQDPTVAKAYAPVGGAFWRPHPVGADCKGPVNMLHTHGWRDGTVPLEGRVLGGGIIEQGDVFQSLQILRQLNGCDNYKANRFETSANLWKRWWTKCTSGHALQFNLYDAGHAVPPGWAEEVIDWFEGLENAEQG